MEMESQVYICLYKNQNMRILFSAFSLLFLFACTQNPKKSGDKSFISFIQKYIKMLKETNKQLANIKKLNIKKLSKDLKSL